MGDNNQTTGGFLWLDNKGDFHECKPPEDLTYLILYETETKKTEILMANLNQIGIELGFKDKFTIEDIIKKIKELKEE